MTWALIHTERAALADDLVDLTSAQWATTSLCTELTVREVLAHLTSAASTGPLRWLAGVLRCRFDFDKQVAMRLAQQLGDSPAETLARFRRVVTSTTKPPLPVLGIHRSHPIETLTRVAEYYAGTDQVVPAKGRIGGLRLEATDGPFTTGTGSLVTGPTLALIMAMTGRTPLCDDLTGDGTYAVSATQVRRVDHSRTPSRPPTHAESATRVQRLNHPDPPIRPP